MTEILFTVEEAPEGGFTARAVGHSVFAVPFLLVVRRRGDSVTLHIRHPGD
mgnify:CR=1 FL=1